MGDTESGAAAHGARGPEGDEDDSPSRAGFLTRLFRREAPEDDDRSRGAGRDGGPDEPGHTGASEMILNVRRLRRKQVDDVCVPRAEIAAASEDSSLEELAAAFQASEMSRLPVYSGSLDQPVGLVHLKDFALRYGFGAENGAFDLKGLLRPLLYVPPSMPIPALLQKMQAARIHMALVIDEYGGVDGLVTIEDLIEQIVGDIGDEHDEDERVLWSQEGEGVYLAQARMDLADFEEAAGVRLADRDLAEEVDTLGGLVIRLAGRVPARGEVVAHPDGHEFEVLDADARRVKRLRIRRAGEAEPRAASEA